LKKPRREENERERIKEGRKKEKCRAEGKREHRESLPEM
jgi:hypothetical protein